ncbi:uncharacterized protein TNIN_426371 [Trichonephila inaurata madagascariensis]|uniref:Uncharacterized protein n=1 Tax=Trichonephila inaurata madagascariensis TaxID=2747483 RepID=A0A8X6WQC6_9ARAC|nr:uncharacterized protein TNIN_426371 [Trichonephila inaurata madagascariensis]
MAPTKEFCAFCGLGPPRFHNDVRRYLNEHLPQRELVEMIKQRWATNLLEPALRMTCDFFLWGYIKDKVFVPPLLRDLVELRGRIRNEFAVVTRDMLVRVWTETEYRLDICPVMKGTHFESL